jgi:tRNA nucleotidyltransferase (CCA-adding enzyme)
LGNISRELQKYLPAELFGLLREVGAMAQSRGEAAYLVGGVVRDLLLGQPNLDLDVVVEGNAVTLARQIAKARNWEVRTHPRFGTAKLCWENLNLDLVTARSETYARPGALPTVEQGTIQADLLRRDFTINAMAARLSPEFFGELLDPHGGQADLRKGLVRVLHRDSFRDDPTRILRALRYEQRLDFHLEQNTQDLVRHGLNNLDTLTGERLWNELELILKERFPAKVLRRADELGVLQKLCPALKGDSWLVEKFTQAGSVGDETLSLPAVYLALLAYRLSEEDTAACVARLKMPGWATRTMRDIVRLRQTLHMLTSPRLRPSEVYHKLESHMPETIKSAAVASDFPVMRERLDRYLCNLRDVKPFLKGDDLVKMGVTPGKELGRILRALLDARLNQEVTSRVGEEALVKKILAMEQKVGPPRCAGCTLQENVRRTFSLDS